MATLWERAVYFATGKMPEDTAQQQVGPEIKPSVAPAQEIRDQLLGIALAHVTDWQQELARPGVDPSAVSERYRDQLGVLNQALAAVRAVDPKIETRLDLDQLQQAAQEQVQSTSQNHVSQLDLAASEWHAIKQAVNAAAAAAEVRDLVKTAISPDESAAKLSPEELAHTLTRQADHIREEWQRDLESGHHNEQDLATYFAGKIDQHNALIEMAVEARPELQQTLPPPVQYQQLRNELQQQASVQNEQQKTAEQAVAVSGHGVSI